MARLTLQPCHTAMLCNLKLLLESLVLLANSVQGGRQCVSQYDSRTYQPGDHFPIDKGCNTCTCLNTGQIECTTRKCQDTLACHYRGKIYAPGAIFEEACTICVCGQGGYVACRIRRNCDISCTYQGRRYAHGEPILNREKCQICHCFHGNVNCRTEVSNLIAGCFAPKPYCRLKDKTYRMNEVFVAEDGCTMCVCRHGGYIACSKHRCPKNECVLGNRTLAVGESVLVLRKRVRLGQSRCAVCICHQGAVLRCDRSHKNCSRLPTEGVCVYKNKLYFEARHFLEPHGNGACSQCQCNPNGRVACSAHASSCPADTKTCNYNNATYISGDYFIDTKHKYWSRKPSIRPKTPSPTNIKGVFQHSIRAKLQEALRQMNSGKKIVISGTVEKKLGRNQLTYGYRDCPLCTCDVNGEVTCVNSRCRVRTCRYMGKSYYVGQTFLEQDGCRGCACATDGKIRCRDRKCNLKLTRRPAATTCVHEDKTYRQNDIFIIRENSKCLRCTCAKWGKVQCKGTHCRSTSAESRFSCNYMFFGMFISTLKACKLVEE